jgi:hypothetical protein
MNRDLLRAPTEQYLKSIFALVVRSADGRFDFATAFGEMGVDSLNILKVIKQLEADFGTLRTCDVGHSWRPTQGQLGL